MTGFVRNLLAGTALVSISLAGHQAQAQGQQVESPQAGDAAATDGDNAADQSGTDIIVTAEFREANLQRTPIAITALNSEMLDARGIDNVVEVAQAAPNVSLAPSNSNNGKSLTAFIRGIGQSDSNPAFEPGVGVYIDDVYYATAYGAIFDLVDPSRIEVLRGPQGTLAGRNSIGGAIKLYSNEPDGSSDGYVEASYGSNNAISLRAGADFTLSPDTVFVRVSGVAKSGGGYVDRLDYGCLNPASGVPSVGGNSESDCRLGKLGGDSIVGGRVFLRAVPSERLEISLIADVLEDSSGGIPQTLLFAQTAFTPGADARPFVPQDPLVSYATYMDPIAPVLAFEPRSQADQWGLSGKVEYDLGGGFSITSITAYRETHGRFTVDGDASPQGLYTANLAFDANQFTQELRLNGTVADIVDFTIGGYYYTGDIANPGRARAFFTFDQVINDTVSNESIAGFANASVEVIENLTVIAGVRYTEDQKDYTFVRSQGQQPPYGLFGLFGTLEAIDGTTGEFRGDRLDYRFGLEFQATSDVMLYAQTSTGYKGGGINPRPFYSTQVVPFDPETLTSYEIGMKSQFFDRRMRLNVAGFYSEYEDILLGFSQCPALIPPGSPPFCSLVDNAGSAEIMGIELETTVEPIDGFTIDGTLAFLDFEYTNKGNALVGDVAPFTPKWKMAVGAQYVAELGGGSGFLVPRLDWIYQSEIFTEAENAPLSHEPGYDLLNGRITWRSADEDLELGLAVTNILDEDYYQNRNTGFISSFGVVTGIPGRPREFRVFVSKDF